MFLRPRSYVSFFILSSILSISSSYILHCLDSVSSFIFISLIIFTSFFIVPLRSLNGYKFSLISLSYFYALFECSMAPGLEFRFILFSYSFNFSFYSFSRAFSIDIDYKSVANLVSVSKIWAILEGVFCCEGGSGRRIGVGMYKFRFWLVPRLKLRLKFLVDIDW